VFADNLGHARHMAVAPNGVVYVNTWSGRYYGNDKPPPGGFLAALQATKGDGHADVIRRFGPRAESSNAGGTGIALYKGALYAETNDRIVRYALPPGTITPSRDPDVIVSGLPLTGDHPMHPFVIDAQGHMYVDLGSATNSCQAQNRFPILRGGSPAPNCRCAPGLGFMTPIGRTSDSRRLNASWPAFAMAKALPSMPREGFMRRSTAVIS
jgi:glucose/arabinose dehydrogenase